MNNKRLIMRLRLETSIVYIGSEKVQIDPMNICKWCNMEEQEDWTHVIYYCQYLDTIRPPTECKLNRMNGTKLIRSLKWLNNEQANELSNFLFKVARKETIGCI